MRAYQPEPHEAGPQGNDKDGCFGILLRPNHDAWAWAFVTAILGWLLVMEWQR